MPELPEVETVRLGLQEFLPGQKIKSAKTDWPKSLRKPRPKPIPDYEERFRQFRDRRDKSASEFSLDPTLIAPKAILEALARQDPDVLDSLLPWQRTALGVQDTPPAAIEASEAPQAP